MTQMQQREAAIYVHHGQLYNLSLKSKILHFFNMLHLCFRSTHLTCKD